MKAKRPATNLRRVIDVTVQTVPGSYRRRIRVLLECQHRVVAEGPIPRRVTVGSWLRCPACTPPRRVR